MDKQWMEINQEMLKSSSFLICVLDCASGCAWDMALLQDFIFYHSSNILCSMLNHEIQYLNISNPRLQDIQVKLTSPLPASTDSPGLVFGVGPCNDDNGGGDRYDAYMMMMMINYQIGHHHNHRHGYLGGAWNQL